MNAGNDLMTAIAALADRVSALERRG